jgi:hypothetical protein
MGLTIHYRLSVRRRSSVGLVLDLVKATARYARKIGCAHVGKVLHATETDPTAPVFFDSHPAHERRCIGGPGEHGWLVEIWPGEGCETASFGICVQREDLPRRKGEPAWPPRYRTRLALDSFCKTQYAGEHGWEHFLACHRRVIHLLDFWRARGGRAQVHDEGGYWKSRSETKLRKELGDYDRLIAGLGGVFKDAHESGEVIAPIFAYQNFERLEHEGQQALIELEHDRGKPE